MRVREELRVRICEEPGADAARFPLAAKLVERDPRMVERKKTGQLKARKKMAWVKR